MVFSAHGMAVSSPKGNFFSLNSTDSTRTPLCSTRLVGKLLHLRKYNFKAISSVLASAWKLGDRVKFSPLHYEFRVCTFVCFEDLGKVLNMGPWNFRGSLIVLCCSPDDCVFDDLDFDSVELWLHALNLPQCNINRECVVSIGNYGGTFLSVDLGSATRRIQHTFLRIKVQLSVFAKIVPRFFLEREGKTRVWIPFQYERLADFCYGSLSHVEAACPYLVALIHGPLDPSEAFGPWLRVRFSPSAVTLMPSRDLPHSLAQTLETSSSQTPLCPFPFNTTTVSTSVSPPPALTLALWGPLILLFTHLSRPY